MFAMNLGRLLVSVLFALSAFPACAASQRFDLVCAVTVKRCFNDGPPTTATLRLVVDLGANKWVGLQHSCGGPGIEGPNKIQSVTESEILFEPFSYDKSGVVDHRVNRLTGDYRHVLAVRPDKAAIEIYGTCTRASFSGFPVSKF